MADTTATAHRKRRLPGLRRLVRDERGVTAIEFGILAIPFFAIILAILETSYVFLASQILDSAVNDTTRDIRTGVAQTANVDAAGYRSRICDRLFGLFQCENLKIKVSTVANFTSANTPPPINSAGAWTITEGYAAGAGSDVILVEVYYKWPILMSFAGFNLANVGDGTRLMASVRLFKNEPF